MYCNKNPQKKNNSSELLAAEHSKLAVSIGRRKQTNYNLFYFEDKNSQRPISPIAFEKKRLNQQKKRFLSDGLHMLPIETFCSQLWQRLCCWRSGWWLRMAAAFAFN